MKFIHKISEIANQFDLFLIDQYGVVHDGIQAYPGVTSALGYLKSEGKQVYFISNSGKSSEYNMIRNEKIGLPRDLYSGLISSGDVLRRLFIDETQTFVKFAGTKVFNISRDNHPLETGPRFSCVSDIHEADFVVISGLPESIQAQSLFLKPLKIALEKKLMLICANPDKVMISRHELLPGSGVMAENYEKSGGNVIYIGKPYPLIYNILLEGKEQNRILCIGDSIEHDIAGASQVNLPSMFIKNGIYREKLNDPKTQIQPFISEQCEKYRCNQEPVFYADYFN